MKLKNCGAVELANVLLQQIQPLKSAGRGWLLNLPKNGTEFRTILFVRVRDLETPSGHSSHMQPRSGCGLVRRLLARQIHPALRALL
jgi:hypothetical protein